MNLYKFLFPFSLVPKNKKILIYGAGKVGQEYARQLIESNYGKLIGFVDGNAKNLNPMVFPVYEPIEIINLEYDFIVIAVKGEYPRNTILHTIYDLGIEKSKVIVQDNIQMKEIVLFLPNQGNVEGLEFAFHHKLHSMAIYITGGIGDRVVSKCFVDALNKMTSDILIDIYVDTGMEFVKTIYASYNNICSYKYNKGGEYSNFFQRYSLSITLRDSHGVSVDFLNEDKWKDDKEFLKKMKLLQKKARESDANGAPYIVYYQRSVYKQKNCFTIFDYDGVMGIHERVSDIPYNENVELGKMMKIPPFYITVNSGVGEGVSDKYVSKAWKLQSFDELISKFKKEYQDIAVLQIGGKNVKKISGVDKYFLGLEFDKVMYILKHALIHIDIEGGLVHLATQLKTKCAVLFGPTRIEYFGYPQNINIATHACYGCYGCYDDINICARNMESPICMASITPKIVLEHIKGYIDEQLKQKMVKNRVLQ